MKATSLVPWAVASLPMAQHGACTATIGKPAALRLPIGVAAIDAAVVALGKVDA